MGNHEAIGHAFHITNDDPHTWDAIMSMYGQILGVEPKIVHVPTTFIGKLYPEKYNAILGDMSENAILTFENCKNLFQVTVRESSSERIDPLG